MAINSIRWHFLWEYPNKLFFFIEPLKLKLVVARAPTKTVEGYPLFVAMLPSPLFNPGPQQTGLAMTDQPARGPDDRLLDASKIICSMMQMIPNLFDQVLACNKVVNILVRSDPMQSCKHKAPAKHERAIMDDTNTDADDTDFTASSAEYGSEDPSDATEISNEEVQNILT
ncbi:hypothetical protein F5148DRAFT_1151963 [Russula earlei]|uniref:Uncharacterized protein n=1 Tax=Russula earlei TaxID=71964 RepID=A0ACC0TY63_9AGAM|nr:hypothetical protein F5148DRAFT_1151963 [Russula earlei]